MYSAMPIQAVSSGVGVSRARSREICVCTSSPPPPGHCTYTRRLPILEQRHPGHACPILPMSILALFCQCRDDTAAACQDTYDNHLTMGIIQLLNHCHCTHTQHTDLPSIRLQFYLLRLHPSYHESRCSRKGWTSIF